MNGRCMKCERPLTEAPLRMVDREGWEYCSLSCKLQIEAWVLETQRKEK